MIRAQREAQILSILRQNGAVSIRDLSARFGEVSDVTLRRDLVRLAERGALIRTRGGARQLDELADHGSARDAAASEASSAIGSVDAIVLPPISGRGANTLRMRVRRRRIPFLAESSPQEGGVYLGPDNRAAGRDLGRFAGATLAGASGEARVLAVSLEDLPNTRARSDGFLEGFADAFGGPISVWRVDGKGAFRTALRASLDVLAAHPEVNVLFGVNDHSILAALEAAERLGIKHIAAFSVGGEGSALFEELSAGARLRATAALFPEVVGARAVDVLAEALAGGELPDEVATPHALITPETLPSYYRRNGEEWLLAAHGQSLVAPPCRRDPDLAGRSIGFMPHYPAHDWYRIMSRAMRERAELYGMRLVLAAPSEGIAREIDARRTDIARAAVRRIGHGETVLINAGPVALALAEALDEIEDVTVVTNSLEVMERVSGRPGVKVMLTSGEYQPAHRCLVGPSLGALFETLRVDRVFLSVDGISVRFGTSAADERMALAGWRFVEASRKVHALADHSILGLDANHRIAPIGSIHELITDSGSLPADRLAFAAAGLSVSLADEELEEDDAGFASTHRPVGAGIDF